MDSEADGIFRVAMNVVDSEIVPVCVMLSVLPLLLKLAPFPLEKLKLDSTPLESVTEAVVPFSVIVGALLLDAEVKLGIFFAACTLDTSAL